MLFRSGAPAARAAAHLRRRHHFLDLLDAGEHRAERDELRLRHVGDDSRERRLAGAGRAPEDDRLQQVALDRSARLRERAGGDIR